MSTLRTPFPRTRIAMFVGIASLLCFVMCGGAVAPARGGLVLVLASDGSLAMDRVSVKVVAHDQILLQEDFGIPATPLPNTLSIVSNGKATDTATITITAFHGDTAVDRRDAIIRQTPVDRVVTLRLELSARCSAFVTADGASTCSSGQTCSPTSSSCADATVDATQLPTFDGIGSGGNGSSDAATGDTGSVTAECSASVACPHQTCIDGTCQGECTAGERSCDLLTSKTCGADGHWAAAEDVRTPSWTQTYGTDAGDESHEPQPSTLAILANGDALMVGVSAVAGTAQGYAVSFDTSTGAQKWQARGGTVFTSAVPTEKGATVCGYVAKGSAGCTSSRDCAYCTSLDPFGVRGPEQIFKQSNNDFDIIDVVAASGTSLVGAGRTTQTDAYFDITFRSLGVPNNGGNPIFTSPSTPFSLTPKSYQDEMYDLATDSDGTVYGVGYLGIFGSCQRYSISHFSAGTSPSLLKDIEGPCSTGSQTAPLNAFRAVIPLGDGTVLVAGSQLTDTAHDVDGVLARWKFMDNGVAVTPTPVWSKTFGGTGYDAFYGGTRLPDGGLLLVGATSDKPQTNAQMKTDIWVVRTDAAGTMLWSKTYGGTGNDRATAVKRTKDGAYLITGQTAAAGSTLNDFYAFKIAATCP